MQRAIVFLMGLVLLLLVVGAGCTQMEMEPSQGPPGTTVYVKACNMFGDPAKQSLKWDGDTIRNPFPGSFVVPAVDQGGEPGKHKVTLVDNLDGGEVLLWFPLLRVRHASETFTVVE